VDPADPVATTVLYRWQPLTVDSAHDGRAGDAKQLGDLARREPVVVVVRSEVDALVSAPWPPRPGSPLSCAARGKGLDLAWSNEPLR
jgi:hypothetical protein